MAGIIVAVLHAGGCMRQAPVELDEVALRDVDAGGSAIPDVPVPSDETFGVPSQLPAQAPPPGDPWWAEAAASCCATEWGYAVRRQRPAPNALLAFGPDAARTALRAIVADPQPRRDDELPFTHCFMAAWCLARHDLDYPRGREVILNHLRAVCHREQVEGELGRRLEVSADHVAVAAKLYQHAHDPELLRALLSIAPCANAAERGVLRGVYLSVAQEDCARFLQSLSGCTREQVEQVSAIIAEELCERGGRSCGEWRELAGRLEIVARNRQAPGRDTARDVLVHLNRYVD